MHRIVDETTLTLDQYEALPADDRFIDEVSRGRLVREPRPAYQHGRIVARISQLLANYLDAHPAVGRVVTETGFVLEEMPLTLRGPDIGFVRSGREEPESGFFRGPPDIAIEVVSPSNTAAELQQKVLEFLGAGSPLVWIVYPDSRTVVAHRSGGDITLLRETDALTTALLPGFELSVASLFQ